MSRRRADSLGTIDTINVTPLVDLTFLLLIVFMITAPALEYTVSVQPPQLNAETIEDPEHLIITLDATGQLYLKENAVSEDLLMQRLAEASLVTPSIQVFVRADEARPYGEVVEVLRLVKSAGLSNFSLVTASEDP